MGGSYCAPISPNLLVVWSGMTQRWKTVKAAEVQPGDRVRTADGTELTATHIEAAFFGQPNMIAFIEDTPDRWFKRPVTIDADVEVHEPD
jgi:hypothetical protein